MFGCWDTGLGNFPKVEENFATREGIQAQAIKGMIDRLISPQDHSEAVYDYEGLNLQGFFGFILSYWRIGMQWVIYWPEQIPRFFIIVFLWYP